MKKTHIAALVLVFAAIAVLVTYLGNTSTYDTIASARAKQGRFVHLIAKVDKNRPFQYDPAVNPNYLSFTALDTLGNSVVVVYHNAKPTDMEKSERLVLKGKMVRDASGEHFECGDILLKCPSKYKDDPANSRKAIGAATTL